MIGNSIAHYRINAKLGAGGMGEVYRATDTKLNREIALKVLPEDFAQDGERMARLQREAQVLASLNHPNIAAIYGLEESGAGPGQDQLRALVMELVEGPTLAERIQQAAIPVEEALPMARQLAEALEYAHEHGVIHRDLKPANIKLTVDGRVKILDFGLAKAFSDVSKQDLPNSPTLSMAATKAGIILGTAAYMSPEQARGRAVNKRADIWAFGCVLYEMLAGRQAFRGDTVSDTLAAILKDSPDWKALPTSTPPPVVKLLRRCLEKDPSQRLHDVADARLEIQEAIANPDEIASPASEVFLGKRFLPWALVAALGLLVSFLGSRAFSHRDGTEAPPVRLTIILPANISWGDPLWPLFVFSPDGKRLVLVGRENNVTRLYIRRLDRWEFTPIRGTEGALRPFFSPDGEWVAFWSPDRKLKKVSVEGGATVEICSDIDWGAGAWGTDDQIVFPRAYNSGLSKVSANGGLPQVLTTPDTSKGELGHWWPQILPGGENVLLTAFSTPLERSRIVVRSLRTGEQRTLIEGATDARYVSSGHLVFSRGETILAVPFDWRRREVAGAPFPVLEGVTFWPQNGLAQLSIADDGTMAYLPAQSIQTDQKLVAVDRQGRVQTLREHLLSTGEVRVSPEGHRIAMALRQSGRPPDVWVYDLDRGSLTRITNGPASNMSAMWTPDGRELLHISEQPVFDLYRKQADGSGKDELVLTSPNDKYPLSVSPDGKTLLVSVSDPRNGPDLWTYSLAAKPEGRELLATPSSEESGAFSPDGQWIAYQSNQSGRPEIYVQSYPKSGNRVQVSTDGGAEAVWARNGKELFFREGSKLMVVAMNGGMPAKPMILFEESFIGAGNRLPAYDISPDGQHFYFFQSVNGNGDQPGLRVVLNWFDDLRRRVPSGGK